MVGREVPINYYKCFYRGFWCIISFRCHDPLVADNIVRRFIRSGVVWKRISPEEFINHTLKYFASYRLGALRFDVGSRDSVSYSYFFYSRLIGCYDCSYQESVSGIYTGIVLPVSKT